MSDAELCRTIKDLIKKHGEKVFEEYSEQRGFLNFLIVIDAARMDRYFDAEIDSYCIECKGDYLYCGAIDSEMKIEAKWYGKIEGFEKKGKKLAFEQIGEIVKACRSKGSKFSRRKFSISEDKNGGEPVLCYEIDDGRRIIFRLADAAGSIDKASEIKPINQYLHDGLIEFFLNTNHIQDLLEYITIFPSKPKGARDTFFKKYIRFFSEGNHVKAEIGVSDPEKIVDRAEIPLTKLEDDTNSVSAYLDAEILSPILRTARFLNGTIRISIKEGGVPVVVKLGNIGNNIDVVYLMASYPSLLSPEDI
jgi:hypothetical protein